MRIPLSATMGAVAVLAATPAGAAARDITGVLTATGGVTVTFSGDPARGCADAGLCGYSGSVEIAPHQRRGQYFLSIADGHTYESESGVALTKPAAVTVQRSENGAQAGTCSDSDEELEIFLAARVAKPGRARFGLLSPDMSTGRCAGPALERALLRLPAHVVPVEQVSNGNATIDMSGQTAFSSGRFSGTISSTLRFHLGRATPDDERLKARQAASRARLIRVASVDAVYRIVRFRGTLDASFEALTGPPCSDLDACGVTGSATWRIDARGGEVAVVAAGPARRSDRGLRGALAAIRRPGAYADTYAELSYVFGTTTADVARPGGSRCHDAVRADSPGLDALWPASGVRVELGGPDAIASAADLLRAGCPGPRYSDAVRPGAIASGRLRLTSLARRRLTLKLAGHQPLRGPGYSGSANGRFTLELKRRSLRVDYRRTRFVLPP